MTASRVMCFSQGSEKCGTWEAKPHILYLFSANLGYAAGAGRCVGACSCLPRSYFWLESVKGPAQLSKLLFSSVFNPIHRVRATPNRRQGDSDPPTRRLRSPDGACACAALVDNLGVNETTNPQDGEFGVAK